MKLRKIWAVGGGGAEHPLSANVRRGRRGCMDLPQQMPYNHTDRCVCGTLERERASSSVPAATFVKMSGDACNQTHEWQLLGLNMGLNGNF